MARPSVWRWEFQQVENENIVESFKLKVSGLENRPISKTFDLQLST